MFELWQVIGMCTEQLIDHPVDLLKAEHGCGQRIVADSVENHARITGKGSGDGQVIAAGIDVVEDRQVGRQITDETRYDATW